MKKSFLSKGIAISIIGHFTMLGLFSFSFGNKPSGLNSCSINSIGAILGRQDLSFSPLNIARPLNYADIKHALNKADAVLLAKSGIYYSRSNKGYSKPAFPVEFKENKTAFTAQGLPPFMIKKKPVIMFYPRLPQYFNIYFQDRQVAHIELLFDIVPRGESKSVIIKRKISSGNLEVDLLSMRYISHYLFVQRMNFTPNYWQTVKIDLSAKSD